jgi:hypothetical protein
VIPPFDARGNRPPGIHRATWAEVVARFGTTPHRRDLLAGLREALAALARAGCVALWLDGSFVTAREEPGDYDGAWEVARADVTLLDEAFPGEDSPTKTKARYGGMLYPISAIVEPSWSVLLEFFQFDKAGNRRGIVAIDPRSIGS